MGKMMLIDGSSLLFRSFYATMPADPSKVMRSSDGTPTNAIYGLSSMIFRLLTDYKPEYVLVAFDTWAPTKRHDEFEEYKAGRRPAPEELIPQFPLSRELFKAFGIVVYEDAGIEADDIVGCMAKKASKAGMEVMVVSGDKDLLQLIDDNITVYLTRKGVTELERMDEAALYVKYQLKPNQIPDFKGLMGDPSDNIPGIKGVGEKTAIKLLLEYGNMETILASDIKGALGEKIKSSVEVAKLSKRLATIMCDVNLPFDIENIKYNGADAQALTAFFNKYNMRSHLKMVATLCKKEEETEAIKQFNNQVEVVTKIGDLLKPKPFALVVEQLEKNYFLTPIYGVAVYQDDLCLFASIDDVKKDLAFLKLLKNEKVDKYVVDSKQTINGLLTNNIEVNGLVFDLLLVTYLLEPSTQDNEKALFNYYHYELPPLNKNNFADDLPNYSGAKANFLYKIQSEAMKRLIALGEDKLYHDIELPLASILAKMERVGIRLDVNVIKQMENEVNERLTTLTEKIYELANHEFNINSPSQVANVLYDELGLKANRKRSTSADYLEEIAASHPIIPFILTYRKYSKLQSTYIIGLQNYVHSDGKIHTIFNQAVAQTGRLSAKEPNLQNITIKDEEQRLIRKAFFPSDSKNYILSVDYSQIELRVLAHMANATSLIEAFNNDEDIHTQTAMKVFGIDDPSKVTKNQRSQAKAVNFGIIYGISDWGLADQIGVSVGEAKEFIERYFATYPEIKTYLNNCVAECEKNGYVKTIFNRIRYVKEINDTNYNVKEFGKRIAMNSPIQGSAADIIKKAMIDVVKMLKDNNYKTELILQIHDELIFEVPYDELMTVIDKICEVMENCVELKVKLKVDYGYGYNWYQAK